MVAEGVEDDGSLAVLTRLGCDQAQGFYLSRPMPIAELDHRLRRRNIMGDQTENTEEPRTAAARSLYGTSHRPTESTKSKHLTQQHSCAKKPWHTDALLRDAVGGDL